MAKQHGPIRFSGGSLHGLTYMKTRHGYTVQEKRKKRSTEKDGTETPKKSPSIQCQLFTAASRVSKLIRASVKPISRHYT